MGPSTIPWTTGEAAFTTDASGLPERASAPTPTHLVVGVGRPALELAWQAGAGSEAQRVYLGREFPLPQVGETEAPSFDLEGLEANAVYYWRVDGVNAVGARIGTTWRFTTVP